MKRLALLLGLLLCFCCASAVQPRAEAYGVTAEELYPQVVSSEELERLARQTLSRMLLEAAEGKRCSLETVHVPHDLRLPEGSYRLEAAVPNGLRYWGNTAVQIKAVVDGKPFRQIVCHFKLHLYAQVAVATRLLMPGSPLGEGDFRFEEREIGNAPRKYVLSRKEALGLVPSRPIQPGQPLQGFMLHQPVVVASGKQVTIVARVNGVSVRMEGVALENGRTGRVIRVRNVTTKRLVKARVVDAETVEAVAGL